MKKTETPSITHQDNYVSLQEDLVIVVLVKSVPHLRNMSTSISIDTPSPALKLFCFVLKYLQKLLLLEYPPFLFGGVLSLGPSHNSV